MLLQRLILEYLSIDFSTHTCTPPQGCSKCTFDTPVGEYRYGSENRLRVIPKQTFAIASGVSVDLIVIQKTEIFFGQENGLNAPCPSDDELII